MLSCHSGAMQSIEPGSLEIPQCAIAHLRSGPSDHPGMTNSTNRVAPPPTPGGGVIRFGAARHLCKGEAFRRAELCRYFDLADRRLRQHARRTLRNCGSRQRDIGEPFVLERQLRGLDLLVRARALQALGEMAPVRRLQRAFAVMRAGGGDMCTHCNQPLTQRDDAGIAGRRAGFDHEQRVARFSHISSVSARRSPSPISPIM